MEGSMGLQTPVTGLPLVDDRSTQGRSEEHTSELQSQSNLVCRLLLEKKKKQQQHSTENGLLAYKDTEPPARVPHLLAPSTLSPLQKALPLPRRKLSQPHPVCQPVHTA